MSANVLPRLRLHGFSSALYFPLHSSVHVCGRWAHSMPFRCHGILKFGVSKPPLAVGPDNCRLSYRSPTKPNANQLKFGQWFSFYKETHVRSLRTAATYIPIRQIANCCPLIERSTTFYPGALASFSKLQVHAHPYAQQAYEHRSRSGYEDDQNAIITERHDSLKLEFDARPHFSKFLRQEKSKEHRFLVNQLLKDKGPLSYDWRIPLRLLELHYRPSYSSETTERNSVSRNAPLGLESPFEKSIAIHGASPESLSEKPMRIAQDVSKPAVWTESALVQYIRDLTESQLFYYRVPLAPQTRANASSNRDKVINGLDEIFQNTNFRRIMSAEVYNIALQFYYAHGMVSRARELFVHLEESKIGIPRETFNIVLRFSASSKDLHNFTFILHRATLLGFKPDEETWCMLLMAVSSDQVRAVIIQRMRERNIVDDVPNNIGARRIIIQNEMVSCIEQRGDRGDFLNYMDQRYGRSWLTTSVGNKLLYEHGKRRSIPETLALLAGMRVRGFVPDQISLDTLLQQCLLLRQHRNAIETLKAFSDQFGLKPGKQTYQTLFAIAWVNHFLNLARIVWRSACIQGCTTATMHRLVHQSLSTPFGSQNSMIIDGHDAERKTRGGSEIFKQLVGRFVLFAPKPQDFKLVDVGNLSVPSNVSSPPLTTIKNDLNIAGTFKLDTLGELLAQAIELDLKWAAEKFWHTSTLQQVIEGGIRTKPNLRIRRKRSVNLKRTPSLSSPLVRNLEQERFILPKSLEARPQKVGSQPLDPTLRKSLSLISRSSSGRESPTVRKHGLANRLLNSNATGLKPHASQHDKIRSRPSALRKDRPLIQKFVANSGRGTWILKPSAHKFESDQSRKQPRFSKRKNIGSSPAVRKHQVIKARRHTVWEPSARKVDSDRPQRQPTASEEEILHSPREIARRHSSLDKLLNMEATMGGKL